MIRSCDFINPERRFGWHGPENYRSMSLLNVDNKLFARILASELKGYLAEHIKQDQVGFLPRRHLKDNIGVLLNIIEWADKHPGTKLGILFIYAEKAFDKLEWDFLKYMLEEIDIGLNFSNSIKRFTMNKLLT